MDDLRLTAIRRSRLSGPNEENNKDPKCGERNDQKRKDYTGKQNKAQEQ